MELTFNIVDQKAVRELMEEDAQSETEWGMRYSETSFGKAPLTERKLQNTPKPHQSGKSIPLMKQKESS
jgi:hypothetical protein